MIEINHSIKVVVLFLLLAAVADRAIAVGQKPPTLPAVVEEPTMQPTAVITPTQVAITQPLNQAEKILLHAQNNINFFHANFQLTVVDKQTTKTHLQASGKVWLAGNRCYRVEYDQPEKQVLVSNGKQRWLYLPKLNQVQIQAMPPEGNPAELFLELGGGLARILDTCQVSFNQPQDRQRFVVRPREKSESEFEQAIIWTKGENYLPVKLKVESERTIVVNFEHVLVKVGQDKMTEDELKQFEFILPKDAEVIEMFWPMK